jgi:3-deoxy-manno-octulosonate cytidylyltransferase (CMP-KDO synthetase)
MTAVAIIPARFASTRFPGKPVAAETGKYLIQHVYERAAAARRVDRVIVATDDTRIADAVASFGGEAVMTRADHATGSERIAEVVAGLCSDSKDVHRSDCQRARRRTGDRSPPSRRPRRTA